MGAKLGMRCKLYRNTGTWASPTWVEVGNVKDVTLNLEKGEADVTTRNNAGWRAKVGTLKEGSVEFEMVWDPTDGGFAAIQAGWFNDTDVELAIMDGDIATPGSEGLHGMFSVINFNRKEPLEEAATAAVSLSLTYSSQYQPEWKVVS